MNPPPHLGGAKPRGSLLGRLALRFWHRPRGQWAEMQRIGWDSWWSEKWGMAAMRRAALKLGTEKRSADSRLTPVVFLTGQAYWHETLFCLHSLVRHLETPPPIRIISDGTLDARLAAVFSRQFPHAELISTAEVETAIDRKFPLDRYPLIRFYRDQKPIMRKLLDVFSLHDEPQLLLDSDMLFFQRPTTVMNWLHTPEGFLAMTDVKTAYGYSPALMEKLAGTTIPPRINIGFYGLAGNELDWNEIESWIRTLTETEGLQYNLCQGLSALLFARAERTILDARDYLVLPDKQETLNPTAVMHHYVAESKEWYRRYGWRHVSPAPSVT